MPKRFESIEARRAFYRDLMRERRAAEKAGVKPAETVRRCSFCRKPESSVAFLWGTDPFICDECLTKADRAVDERLERAVRRAGAAMQAASRKAKPARRRAKARKRGPSKARRKARRR
jgi:hypothetical protein